jgi:hypothetical protein
MIRKLLAHTGNAFAYSLMAGLGFGVGTTAGFVAAVLASTYAMMRM